jgi:hypothetical protein
VIADGRIPMELSSTLVIEDVKAVVFETLGADDRADRRA